MSSFRPGGDAQAIARIAVTHYGGFLAMFDSHKWPERGSDMMRKVQTRVKDRYGSIAAFVETHEKLGELRREPAEEDGSDTP